MRRLVVKMEMSLDGYVGRDGEDPQWPLEYFDEHLASYERRQLMKAGVHAMGRIAYEAMAPYWQQSTESFAPSMNDTPKAVFSRSLPESEATWPVTTVYRDLSEGIAELKAQGGYEELAPVLAHGGASFVQQLTRLRLVDEYRICVHPVVFGQGYRLFTAPERLYLISTRFFAKGSLAHTYVPEHAYQLRPPPLPWAQGADEHDQDRQPD